MTRAKVIGANVEITPMASLTSPELAEDLAKRRRIGVDYATVGLENIITALAELEAAGKGARA